jgi:queuine tRNA-ribosyltransferase
LFSVAEPTASRLVSLHNIAWTIGLMNDARQAIVEQRYEAFRALVLSVWE